MGDLENLENSKISENSSSGSVFQKSETILENSKSTSVSENSENSNFQKIQN